MATTKEIKASASFLLKSQGAYDKSDKGEAIGAKILAKTINLLKKRTSFYPAYGSKLQDILTNLQSTQETISFKKLFLISERKLYLGANDSGVNEFQKSNSIGDFADKIKTADGKNKISTTMHTVYKSELYNSDIAVVSNKLKGYEQTYDRLIKWILDTLDLRLKEVDIEFFKFIAKNSAAVTETNKANAFLPNNSIIELDINSIKTSTGADREVKKEDQRKVLIEAAETLIESEILGYTNRGSIKREDIFFDLNNTTVLNLKENINSELVLQDYPVRINTNLNGGSTENLDWGKGNVVTNKIKKTNGIWYADTGAGSANKKVIGIIGTGFVGFTLFEVVWNRIKEMILHPRIDSNSVFRYLGTDDGTPVGGYIVDKFYILIIEKT